MNTFDINYLKIKIFMKMIKELVWMRKTAIFIIFKVNMIILQWLLLYILFLTLFDADKIITNMMNSKKLGWIVKYYGMTREEIKELWDKK